MRTNKNNCLKQGLASEIVLIIIALILLAGIIVYLNHMPQTSTVSPTATSSTPVTQTASSSGTTTGSQSPNAFLNPAHDFITSINPSDSTLFDDPHLGFDTIRQIPTNAVFLIEFPFHESKKTLYIYVSSDNYSQDMVDPSTKYYLVVKDNDTGALQYASAVDPVSIGGNSGAIFLPIALTPDDQNIIARAKMGDPGAGGGSVDYGYTRIPVSVPSSAEYNLQNYAELATPEAVFYENYQKVVYLDQGANTPVYPRPGPRSTSEVVATDVSAVSPKVLLATKDTMYKIGSFDENTRTLSLQATKYGFSNSCPRGAELQGCEATSTTTVTVVVPK